MNEESKEASEATASDGPGRQPPRLAPPKGVDPTEVAAGPIFDLTTAEGETESERFLARLCRHSFLSLWSYPNTFTDEGVREDGASSGNEFADVLVVFGDDVILFSDKHIRFSEGVALDVAWPRWFKSAITKSVRQLYGAMNWAKRFPGRVYQDAACKKPLPVPLPPPDRARFQLVATTRGSFVPCSKHFKGSLGTHQINTGIVGKDHHQHPFTIGVVEPRKQFVHVFDEFSLEAVLRERDTAADFIAYLKAREELLTSGAVVIAAGEEQLLAAYMTNMRDGEHWFLPPQDGKSLPDILWFDESHWPGLHERPEYKAKKVADRTSYLWDRLVDRFIKEGNPGIMGATTSNQDLEVALRIIASKSRFERRFLSDVLLAAFEMAKTRPDARRMRLFSTLQQPEVAYAFLIDPLLPGEDYAEYRRRRASFLQIYLQCAKLRMPEATTFIGMAFDHPVKDYAGYSEDLAVYRLTEDAEVDLVELRRLADDVGILAENLPLQHSWTQDFPHQRPESPAAPIPRSRKKAKGRNKMAKASRRKNRRK